MQDTTNLLNELSSITSLEGTPASYLVTEVQLLSDPSLQNAKVACIFGYYRIFDNCNIYQDNGRPEASLVETVRTYEGNKMISQPEFFHSVACDDLYRRFLVSLSI
jgi:hypothetical protein